MGTQAEDGSVSSPPEPNHGDPCSQTPGRQNSEQQMLVVTPSVTLRCSSLSRRDTHGRVGSETLSGAPKCEAFTFQHACSQTRSTFQKLIIIIIISRHHY